MKKYSLLMLFIFLGTYLMAQRSISGVVSSESDGLTLPGASVVLKGTTTGVATDENGKFTIQIPEGDGQVLVISSVGMQTKEVAVGASNTINVSLGKGVLLDEVVVDALGFEKPKDQAGSASSSLKGTSLQKTGEVRLINSMAGKTAGVNITQATGDPGAGSRIQIRGATSITGDLEPLVILDGVPIFNDSYYGEGFGGNLSGSSGSVGSGGGVTQQSRLNDINPNDIESMEILRGASAAAIWGSRAANGVIVITTKKGSAGPTEKTFVADFTSSIAFDRVNQQVDLNEDYGQGFGQQYLSGTPFSWGDKISGRAGGTDAYITDPNAPGYAGVFIAEDGDRYYAIAAGDATNVHGGKNDKTLYDPYETIFETGITFENNLGIRSADEKGSIYFSLSDMKQDGVIKENSTFRRNAARLNATRYLGEKLTLNANLGYTRSNSNRVQMGSNLSGLFLGGLRSAIDFNDEDHTGTYIDPNGNIFTNRQRAYRNPLGANTNSIYDNPAWMMRNILSESTTNRILAKVELSYDVLDWLNVMWRTGVDNYTDEREDFFPSISAGANNGGRFTKETITRTQINSDIIGRAKFKVNDDISGSAIVGMNFNSRVLDDHGTTILGFINPESPPILTNGNTVNGLDYKEEERLVGTYTTVNFNLYDQLFLNLTARLDQLSTLPEDDQSVFYPAFDAAWQFTKMLSDKGILSDEKILSFGKLRLGWGQVGRGPGPYVTARNFFAPDANNTGWGEGWGPGVNPNAYGGGFALTSVAGNPDIKPEIKTEFEIGTDLRFMDNRFGLAFTYYSNKTEDLIIQVDAPESSGALSQFTNAATIENKGIEIEVNGEVMKKGDFRWTAYANYTRNRNEVTEMAGVESFLLSGFTGTSSRAVLGQQLGVIWGSKWARDGGGNMVLDANGFPTIDAEAGVLGDPNPDFRAGIGSNFEYKRWRLGFLVDMAIGGDMWNGTKGALSFFGRTDDSAEETTLTAGQAASLNVYQFDGSGNVLTVADVYPYLQNGDGSYTVRGKIENFGGGDVFLDEAWYYSGPGSGFTGPDEQFVEEASWTRLREVTLSYDLTSDKLTELTKISAASLTFTARNLVLITDYDGNDPNQSLTGPGNNGGGLDYFQNPSTRTYQFTLNLTF